MLVIPAVDIKGGRAVRLLQGRADRETVYDEDPVRAARRWAEAGARRIHVVDLDGAFEGRPKNAPLVLEMLRQIRGPEFEIGGGLRKAEDVAAYLEAGAARCVIGTRAAEDREFLRRLAENHPGRINLGLDARGGWVVTRGWVEVTQLRAVDFIGALAELPLGEVICTDIETDGMLQGPNLKRLVELRAVSPFPLIASGGVTTLEHLRACRELGCYGAIVGKALYDGRLDLRAALDAQLD